MHLLLNSGWCHRNTKACVLHVLCSEKKNAGWKFDLVLVSCCPEMDLEQRELRFHWQGGFQQVAQLGMQYVYSQGTRLCVLLRKISKGFCLLRMHGNSLKSPNWQQIQMFHWIWNCFLDAVYYSSDFYFFLNTLFLQQPLVNLRHLACQTFCFWTAEMLLRSELSCKESMKLKILLWWWNQSDWKDV